MFFGSIGKTRWPPWPLIGWDIFDFSSETIERNSTKTWQEARSKRPLPSLCFSGRSEKQDGAPWPLICWDIFDLSSETAERNSTKLDRKQDLNVLYQVCIFRADQKNKMAALASDWLKPFRLLLWNRWTEFNETWQEARSQRPLPSLWFFFLADRKNKMADLASDGLRHFRLVLWNSSTEFKENWQEARSQRPLPSLCFFRANQSTKMSALADSSKRWHIVLRCTICGPLGLLFNRATRNAK